MSSSTEGESDTDTLYAHTPPWPPHLYFFTCLHKASSTLALSIGDRVKWWCAESSFVNVIPGTLEFMVESAFIWLGAYISSPRDEMQDTNCPEYHEITASRHQGQLQHCGGHKHFLQTEPSPATSSLFADWDSGTVLSLESWGLSEHCPPPLALSPRLPPARPTVWARPTPQIHTYCAGVK